MKRFLLCSMLLMAVTMLAIACSKDDAGQTNTPDSTTPESNTDAKTGVSFGKTLVVFYSYTNNCRDIVSNLSSQIEADIVEISPAEKGLKYEANNYALGTELLNAIKANPTDANSYPAIDPVTTQLDSYSTIIIVTPLWWSQMSPIMQTYLFTNGAQMANKNIGLIVSSASSSISGVVSDCKRLVPNGKYLSEELWINNSNRSNCSTLIQSWLAKVNE